MTVFRGRPAREVAPHQRDDIDAAICTAGPQTADHYLVVEHMVAHDMEWIAAVDPLLDQIGFRRGQPRVAIAHEKASDGWIIHHQKALKQTDAGILVFDPTHIGAVVA